MIFPSQVDANRETDHATTIEHLIALERRIGVEGEAVAALARSQPAVARLAEQLRTTADAHCNMLNEVRERITGIRPSSAELRVVTSLVGLYSALSGAIAGYAALHAIAHRAFDSDGEGNSADLAESHLRAYTRAIQELDVLIPDAVVVESSEFGTDCRCECPACSLGLCLCSPHGANTTRQAWLETLPPPASGGLRVRPPRAGSEAERAEIRSGDRVVAIDDAEIAHDLDARTVQGAIRAHGPGEEMRLTVQGADGDRTTTTLRRP